MSKAVRSRRIVALVAAGAAFASSLCAASAEGSQPPSNHETGCPCAAGCGMQCCGQALIGPPQAVVAFALPHARTLAAAPAIELPVRPASRGPQVPRAPPAA